jgi:pimeloyl-ACP methyl ester carboxylesterase
MNSTKNYWLALFFFGMFLTLVAIVTPFILDRDLGSPVLVTFTDPQGDSLVGSYYPGRLDAGVLLLEGFGSDQTNMRSAASEFAQEGYHVFTFDFSGHGRSLGVLGYDNAQTSRLAYQTLAAIGEFERISGLSAGQIIFFGHSLGARVALQAATIDPSPAGLILLGTQANLETNVQAEFFTGVSDVNLPWVQTLGPENPATNVLLISGQWDDVLTPSSAALLAEKLAGVPLDPNSGLGDVAAGSRRDFVIFPRMLHNYEVFSPRVLAMSKAWAAETLGLGEPAAGAPTASIRIFCWIAGYAGLLISLGAAAGWLKTTQPVSVDRYYRIKITRLRRFLTAKMLLWLLALPLGALLAGFFFFLPIGLPTFNLIYVAFFGGYGILMLLLYWFGRLPGTEGRLPFVNPMTKHWSGALVALALTVLLLAVTAAYTRTGWFFVFPANTRLLWLILFTLPTALSFWIGIYEIGMIDRVAPGKTIPQLAALLIGILPFFLYIVFLASIGSLSGMIGAVQGLLILALVITYGYLLRQFNTIHWVTAFCQAFLLYWLILPQGVLFA